MDFGLNGKRALVCASSQGLGYQSAVALAQEGVEVTLNGRDEGRLEAAQDMFQAEVGRPAAAIVADVATAQGRAALIQACPQVDILINNAGGPPPGSYADWDEGDWTKALEANMLAPIMLAKAYLPTMQENRWGRIINITSAAVRAPIPHLGLSNGARMGLTGAFAGIARQVARDGVTINNILPGPHETGRLVKNYQHIAQRTGEAFETAWEKGASTNPTGSFGDPADFGACVAFLCSTHAKFIVGQNLVLDGGAANISL